MNDDQRKRDEEAAAKFLDKEYPEWRKPNLIDYGINDICQGFYAALRHCRETEVKELNQMVESQRALILNMADRNVAVREQLRVAVETLGIIRNRDCDLTESRPIKDGCDCSPCVARAALEGKE